ncbi:MAG: 4Fe-4S binding protein [Acidobacteria bacterium]|nr:4Fe-4S binding protein [Acidobacteriota bacterium]
MYRLIYSRYRHGRPAVPDPRTAPVAAPFRGLPGVRPDACTACGACAGVCPSKAVAPSPLSLDLGRCVFCGECAKACPAGALAFTVEHRLASDRRESLVLGAGTPAGGRPAVVVRADLRKRFKRSLKLRQVSAGGCNGCEAELNACGNVNFDMGRYGIEFVASPRHADGIVITGPVSANMAAALEDTLLATPEPRIVVAAGACAISGGVFDGAPGVSREFFARHPVDLYVPGCPPHPLTVINGLLALLGRAR